jgi:6,7-dimethyl-8-ribityllumazine synthase
MNLQPAKVYEGQLRADGLRIAIVCARFNEFFVRNLLQGALSAIVRHGGSLDLVTVAWVPGSYEIPFTVRQMLTRGKYDAAIALGMVIQGSTTHAQFINGQVANNIASVAHDLGTPVIYGVVTVEDLDQATERSGSKLGNRGGDAAVAAIEMARLMVALKADGGGQA